MFTCKQPQKYCIISLVEPLSGTRSQNNIIMRAIASARIIAVAELRN